LNHPYIEVEDTAVAIVKFRNGGIGNIVVSNSQKPGIHTKVHIHGSNGASAGVQTDGGAMFIAGRTGVAEPPVNDLWTIPGEEHLLKQWIAEDTVTFNNCDPTVVYMQYQIEDYLKALEKNTDPLVTGEDGRRTVELFTAIYRSSRDNAPVKFPLKPEPGLDGRNF
jgi:predicted dehydrogenase